MESSYSLKSFMKHFLDVDAIFLEECFHQIVDGCVHINESHFLFVEESFLHFDRRFLVHDGFPSLFLELLKLCIGVIEFKKKGILLGFLGAGNLSVSDC